MIIEHAVLQVRPGMEEDYIDAINGATHLIAATPGFRSIRVVRGIESPSQFVLLVEWDTIEAHTEGFRGSEAFLEWRAALHHFYEPAPVVEHFEIIAQA